MKFLLPILYLFFLLNMPVFGQPVYSKPSSPRPTPKPLLRDIPVYEQNQPDLTVALAEIIVKTIYLYDIPDAYKSTKAKPVKKLSRGDILEVSTKNNYKGWYMVKHVSSNTIGYIHGNSINFIEIELLKSNQKANQPKTISLDGSMPVNNKQRNTINRKVDSNSIEKCPVILTCADADLIYSTLVANEAKFEKGKFEKTSEWNARMENVTKDIKLKDGQTLDKELFFFYNLPITTSYDADYERWSFLLQISMFRKSNPCIPVIGQKGSSNCLMISNFHSLNYDKERLEKIYLKMPPNQAKLLDEQLRVAVIGKIISPFFLNDSEDISQIGIWFKLTNIQVFDIKSGKIFETNFKDSSQITIIQGN